MEIRCGTSGYSYKEWKGTFYPADLPDAEMLRAYAERLPAVEINNTFYRLPNKSVLESWAAQVPESFRFALKASRRITHIKRLKNAEAETEYLVRTVRVLGERLGALLFQLPPQMVKNLPRLEKFLDLIPTDVRASFEFRHRSWIDDEVMGCLRSRNHAFCQSDTDEDPADAALVSTATWGYLRLRRSSYSSDDLEGWAGRIGKQGWQGAYAFFKDEGEGTGPLLAARFQEQLGG